MDARSLTPAPVVLRVCLHLLVAGLLALAAVRAIADHAANAPAVVVAAAVMGAVYAAGTVWPSVQTSRRAAAVWLGLLGLAWLALLVVSPDGLWTAFPLYFLQLHLLPVRWSVPAVVVTAGAAIASYVGHSGAMNPGAFIGPLLGAAVAVATVLGYQMLYRESENRRQADRGADRDPRRARRRRTGRGHARRARAARPRDP